jgi:hypothetical protein
MFKFLLIIIMLPVFAISKENKEPAQIIPFNEEKFDLAHHFSDDDETLKTDNKGKSVALAAVFSAVIPGVGEVYSKEYWRGALFMGIEIGLWSGYFIYENKGDDTDAAMRAFGDEHWLDRKYWAKVYTDASNLGIWQGDPLILEDAPPPGSKQISEADYNRYISYFQKLQYDPELGYTHQLPDSKTQQYYEMIYKYQHQFGVGWDDGSTAEHLSPNVITYRDMRNESNDYYQAATTMANFVLLNHLLSAFDAAFAAKKYNREVRLSLRAYPQYVGREVVSIYGLNVTW